MQYNVKWIINGNIIIAADSKEQAEEIKNQQSQSPKIKTKQKS